MWQEMEKCHVKPKRARAGNGRYSQGNTQSNWPFLDPTKHVNIFFYFFLERRVKMNKKVSVII